MTSDTQAQESGGFLPPSLPSPPESPYTANSAPRFELPHPRFRPLRNGSNKESSFINHVDQTLLAISRQYEKRYNLGLGDEDILLENERGYDNFGEIAKDINGVIDVVWVSGTPSLQIPFLLNIAQIVQTSLPAFPYSPLSTFKLLNKLDLAFASLLQGSDIQTGERLPGFEGSRGKLSTTDKVRIRGTVERTRVAVVEVAGKDVAVDENTSTVQSATDTDDDMVSEDTSVTETREGGGHRRWEMDIARVYERTLVELGTSLDSSGLRGFR
ncbi:MAG: hypothetical protein Q9167_002317 [Letrouitia subvulpina]